MSLQEQMAILLSMSQSEFTRTKKAMKTLAVCGVDTFTAIEIVLVGIKRIQVENQERKFAVRNR